MWIDVNDTARNQTLDGLSIRSITKGISKGFSSLGKSIGKVGAQFDKTVIRPQVKAVGRVSKWTVKASAPVQKVLASKVIKPIGKVGAFVEKNVIRPQVAIVTEQAKFVDKNAAPIAAVASVIPGGQPVAAAMKGYLAVKLARDAYATVEQQKEAEAKAKKARAGAIEQLRGAGYSDAQARAIVARMEAGVPIEQALQEYGAPAERAPAAQPAQPVQQQGDQVMASQEQARAAFMEWLRGWRPEIYNAVASQGMAGVEDGGYFDATIGQYVGGLGDWTDTLSTWADKITNVAGAYLKTNYDAKVLDLQLQRAKQQLAPAPTPVVATQAAAAVAPAAVASAASGTGWMLPAAVLGGGLLIYALTRGTRQRAIR